MSARARTAAFAALAIAWAALLYWASSRPNPFPFLPGRLLSHDKLLHAGAYAVLAALVLGAIASGRRGAVGAVLLAASLATAYGATDEWHQSRVPNRDADAKDLAADAAGALAGAAVAAVILRRRRARASIRA
jgi:VanZ family protein